MCSASLAPLRVGVRLMTRQGYGTDVQPSSLEVNGRSDPRMVPPRILVVDDELLVARALARLFRRHGVEVEMAGGANQALGLLTDGPPVQAVISDYRMAGMTGTEFLAVVRERWPEALR